MNRLALTAAAILQAGAALAWPADAPPQPACAGGEPYVTILCEPAQGYRRSRHEAPNAVCGEGEVGVYVAGCRDANDADDGTPQD